MEQTSRSRKTVLIIHLISTILLALAILFGCGMLANSFANNFYSSGGVASYVPDRFTVGTASDYMDESQAAYYLGFYNDELWLSLIDSGALDGTYATFDIPQSEDAEKKEGVHRVFSKAKLDAWMQEQFAQQ